MEVRGIEIMISNSSGLSTRILNLLMSREMCDVQLQVGNQTFDAHKLILCASSDVLKTMLTNQKWTEAHKQTVVLVEEPLCESVFEQFLHYIYSGQLYLSHSTVGPLMTLADKYNVREIIPLCRNYMMENLDAPLSTSCVLQWWEIANLCNDSGLEATIVSYIECNFNKVIQTPDFVSANIYTIEKLLSSSRLAIHNEAMIFYGVMVWLQAFMDFHHPPLEKIKEAFGRLTRHIRWPMMTEDDLNCLRDCSDVQRFIASYRSFICLPNSLSLTDANDVLSVALDVDRTSSPASFCIHSDHSPQTCLSTCDKDVSSDFALHYSVASLAPTIHASSSRSHEKHETFSSLKHIRDKIERKLYMSRVYISDYWCTSLTLSDFLAFPQYGTQTFFFSTPRTGFRHDDGHTLDWEVELCPKGVHYPPAILIGLERDGNKLVDESFIHTVRLSVMSRSPQELPLKVEVNVLVRANSLTDPDCSFIERCHHQTCIFDSKDQRHNLDDIVPYENIGTYLRPEDLIPELYLTPTVAFTLFIVIQPSP